MGEDPLVLAVMESCTYSTGSQQYNQVCGRIIGYQIGGPDTFIFARTLLTYYVDGVSVTTVSPRQHIWTFATGEDEQNTHPAFFNMLLCQWEH